MSLLVVGLVLLVSAQVAGACSGICQRVDPERPFCRQCMDAGYDTGVLCANAGDCGCYYIMCAEATIGELPPAEQPSPQLPAEVPQPAQATPAR
jgi:hypothetical protein